MDKIVLEADEAEEDLTIVSIHIMKVVPKAV